MSQEYPTTTFKFIHGCEYLYIAAYDIEKTRQKREELIRQGYSKQYVADHSSTYRNISLGRWDLENPSERLVDYLSDKPQEYIDMLKAKADKRAEMRLQKSKKSGEVKKKATPRRRFRELPPLPSYDKKDLVQNW